MVGNKVKQYIEIEFSGELLTFLRQATSRGLYESEEELIRDGLSDLKRVGRD